MMYYHYCYLADRARETRGMLHVAGTERAPDAHLHKIYAVMTRKENSVFKNNNIIPNATNKTIYNIMCSRTAF